MAIVKVKYVGMEIGKFSVIAEKKIEGTSAYIYKVVCNNCGEWTKQDKDWIRAVVAKRRNGYCRNCGYNTKGIQKHGPWRHTDAGIAVINCINRARRQGIKIYKKWKKDPQKFADWLIRKGWKKELTIKIIDPEIGYYPSNIKIITRAERNKHNGKKVVHKGKEYISMSSLWEQMAHKSIPYRTFMQRIRINNWSIKKALVVPAFENDSIKQNRRNTTVKLTASALSYFAQKGYGLYTEIGLSDGTKRNKSRQRADICGITLKGNIVICEVKSCTADFIGDQKYDGYIKHCNKMYFVFPYTMNWREHLDKFKHKGIGVLELQRDGKSRIVVRAKYREIEPKVKMSLVFRLIWRNAILSKRTTTRMDLRVRQYLV